MDRMDIDENSEITYEILSGNDGGVFEINPLTGGVRVARPHLVDYEDQREYKLILQAKDGG